MLDAQSDDGDCLNIKARSIEAALSRIGESITEAQAKELAAREQCECRDGMFALAPTRRGLFDGVGLVAAVGMAAMLPRGAEAKAPAGGGGDSGPGHSPTEPG